MLLSRGSTTSFIAILIMAFAMMAVPAKAAWHKAESENFVIYADDKPKDIRRFSQNLERFHQALARLSGGSIPTPSPSNRVTIFVVGSAHKIRKLAGQSRIAGFYVPRAGGSKAFVQTIRNKNGTPDFSTIVLLHEYAHHFLISKSRFEMPRWVSEGGAEFFAAASFEKDGGVTLGQLAQHRAYEVLEGENITVRELLDPELLKERHGNRARSFYGKAWLLYHYLTFHPERSAQFTAYRQSIVDGVGSLEAGERAFGDLDQLQREVEKYKRGRGFNVLPIKPEELAIGDITIEPLSEGEAKVMPLRIQSQRGVSRKQALKLLPDVRKVAARFPDDPGVLTALAEAEHDAGNDAEAIAAADKAIAIDPLRKNAYVQKGFALFRLAKDAEIDDAQAAYDRAMKPFEALNKIENDHTLPLIYYYRSYAERGATPPENARAALERAAQLAPFDKALWFNVGMMWLREGKIALAKMAFQPIAYNPHGGGQSEQAKKVIAALDNLPEGTKVTRAMLQSRSPVEVAPALPDSEDGGSGGE
ncbi:MAG: DUF1570 domain-containing protein [Pseudomonadota bacterium]